ncbi:restriction endonuclease subunit S [Aeromonas hydrophila]|uniref:restriction endonuclease subunit S n=1 Tax=Aeromonas hydrophila TaxID=644 RepID=UPI002B47E632|nr:restriction endonuclease subunit S [Aeromonas hydrophila]
MKWPIVSLNRVAAFINGDRGKNYPSKGDFIENGIPFINAGNISSDHSVDIGGLSYISEDHFHTLNGGKIEKGDIVFCLRGSLGKFATIHNNMNGAIASSLVIIRPNKLVDLNYLKHYLSSFLCQREIKAYENGAAQPNLSAKDLKSFKIPLPPFEEQKRIAAILDKADAIRQKRQQAIVLADDFLRSVFLDMFGDPVTNPKGWPQVEISSLCSDIVDCVNRTAPSVDYQTPYKMVRTTNVKNREINLSDVKFADKEIYESWIRRLKPKRGDIIFTREAPAGEAGIINTDDLIFLGQRTMHFRPNLLEAKPSYLLYELTSSGVQQQIVRCSAGSTVTHLSVPECKKFIIRKPSIALQEKFEKHYSMSLNIKANARKALQLSEQVFFSLSQKAFSGQL